jgi:hypothetical protein
MLELLCDLCIIGNHGLRNMNFLEMGNKVKRELSEFSFVNLEQLKELEILNFKDKFKHIGENQIISKKNIFNTSFDESSGKIKLDSKESSNDQKRINIEIAVKNMVINDIKNVENYQWDYYTEYEGSIHVSNNTYSGFCFDIDFFKITFSFHIKYKDWLHLHKIIRDEWRKYFYQIVKLFGGSKVIYMPQFLFDADGLIEGEGRTLTFEKIEGDLIEIFGENDKRIQDILENEYCGYVVDDFSDINLDKNIDITDFKKYLKNIW